MFLASPQSGCIRQGEILSNVVQLLANSSTLQESDGPSFEERVHPFALVLTQDCDLDWEFRTRDASTSAATRELKEVPNILLCEVFESAKFRPRIKGSDLWQRITRNQDERFQYIQACGASQDRLGEGFPVLVADFKRVFTIPVEEFYRRLSLGLQRRAIWVPPFGQDVANRFSCYFLRVALPGYEASLAMIAPVPAPPE